ncbi:MAG: hypothetical protein ACXADW_02985 [Candidatus Hodarchaeales archaeon]|jgi:3-deoxy-D-manno-octulosonate 8-phosphate phosphatase KdsC-like HAD superfamily phosphatase
MKPIFIFTDFDGCLTPPQKLWYMDHKIKALIEPSFVSYDSSLNVMKLISDHDSAIISLVKHWPELHIIVISGDDRVSKQWARENGLEFIYAPEDKSWAIKSYFTNKILSPDTEYFYLGDSTPDYLAMVEAKRAFYPSDASELLKIKSRKHPHLMQVNAKGGEGVLEEMLLLLTYFGELPGAWLNV